LQRFRGIDMTVRAIMPGKSNQLFAFSLLVAFPVCLAETARAHSWYEVACCSERDCVPVEDGVVVEKTDGVHVQGFGILSRTDPRLRLSRDDRDHLCVAQAGATKLICVYRKPNGM
jgi:hypothetical protein